MKQGFGGGGEGGGWGMGEVGGGGGGVNHRGGVGGFTYGIRRETLEAGGIQYPLLRPCKPISTLHKCRYPSPLVTPRASQNFVIHIISSSCSSPKGGSVGAVNNEVLSVVSRTLSDEVYEGHKHHSAVIAPMQLQCIVFSSMHF